MLREDHVGSRVGSASNLVDIESLESEAKSLKKEAESSSLIPKPQGENSVTHKSSSLKRNLSSIIDDDNNDHRALNDSSVTIEHLLHSEPNLPSLCARGIRQNPKKVTRTGYIN